MQKWADMLDAFRNYPDRKSTNELVADNRDAPRQSPASFAFEQPLDDLLAKPTYWKTDFRHLPPKTCLLLPQVGAPAKLPRDRIRKRCPG